MVGRRGRRRWAVCGAAAAVLVVVGVAAPVRRVAPAGAQPGAPAITVTPLTAPEDAVRALADHVNDAGLITGRAGSGGVSGLTRGVVWQDGSPSYLGNLDARVLDVSERGQVVGVQLAPILAVGFSWSDGVFSPLVPPAPDPATAAFFLTATAVNERGQVLGFHVRPPWLESPFFEAAVWREGEVVAATGRVDDIAVSPRPVDLNERGQAVLNVHDAEGGPWSAVLWRLGGGLTRLGTLGGPQSRAAAIDERGRVAGVAETASGAQHAFVWSGGRMVDLGTLGGATSFVGESLPPPESDTYDVDDAFNDRGEVAGTSETASGDEHAFLWRRGRMVDLGTLGGATSHATALNNRGQVVGYSETASGETHAFLWSRGEMVDLGARAGGGASEALDISDRGQIVGRVGDRAVLWTAPPVRR